MISRPSKIKIGCLEYSLIFSDNIVSILEELGRPTTEAECVQSFIDYQNLKIYVHNVIALQYQKELLLHEILHGLLDNGGASELIRQDSGLEQFICLICPRLHQFLEENQEFISWLMVS